MSDVWAAVIQGVVEGLTEFLPVSSTAHIVIAQKLLQIDNTLPFWKMFTVVIQLGAILAVVAYFWKRLWAFAGTLPRSVPASDTSPARRWYQHPLVLVLISFTVTAVPCFLIDKWIGENLESLLVIGLSLIIGGIVMFWVDRGWGGRAHTENLEQMSMKQAIGIGLAQIFAAAFPGTSRSMATIAGGQLLGLSRSAALEFSFFLSIPVMLAAAGFKLLQHLRREPFPPAADWLNLGVGFVVSFVVAYVVIAWFMGWVRKHGFAPFALYRLLAGAAVLAWLR